MSRGESFLGRWSRLKRAGGEAPPAAAGAAPALPLPDPDTLGFDDDFRTFLRREVEEGVRRLALKKLFHSPQFNVMDGLDVYIDDYTVASPLDAATLRQIEHARDMLFGDDETAAAADTPGAPPTKLAACEPAAVADTLPAALPMPAGDNRQQSPRNGDDD
ncbi:MAG: DUF3306 domain-containing protein [Rhodocyclaceae bacterium]|nr:DUF3306 domain-containing protein [Rhodocyclaceae bacterium]